MTSPVLIVGGGIGGLTAALCLARAGVPAVLFEQAPTFGEVGAGVQITPNASRVLHRLGLAGALAACASEPAGIEYRHWRSGKRIARWAFDGRWARAGAPYYHVHRADLVDLLAAAAERQPGLSLRLGARVENFTADGDGVRVAIAGTNAKTAGMALVGTDGIHSAVRGAMLAGAEPRFAGLVAWRALVPAASLPAGSAAPWTTVWWGPRRHFVHYAVRRGELVNCVGVVARPARGEVRESWRQRGELAALRADFAGWHEDVQRLIDAVPPESLHQWALFDRRALPRWRHGPATLLGDAAHPMLPFVAQGAAMAIEDAAVLAACLAGSATPADAAAALRRYEALRRPRTAKLQRLARYNARLFHLAGGAAWLRDRLAPAAARRTLARIYRYDALAATAGKKSRQRTPTDARQATT